MRITALPVLVVCVLTTAVPAASPAQQVIRSTRGDTTFVRTTGNGVWGPPTMAAEVLRVGNDREETTLGQVTDLVALRNGAVVLYDRKGLEGPRLRLFDPDGRFLRTIGGEGSGPGEYSNMIWLAASPDGSLIVRDPRNARVTTYRPDGGPQTMFTFTSGFYGQDMVHGGIDGNLYLAILTGRIEHNAPWPIGFVKLSGTGAVLDTIRPPSTRIKNAAGSPYEPSLLWTIMPDGGIVSTETDRPVIVVHTATGAVLAIDHPIAATPYAPEERHQLQALLDYRLAKSSETYTGPKLTVPPTKPLAAAIRPDLDQRIWVRRHPPADRIAPRPALSGGGQAGPAIPTVSHVEPPVWDAFRTDGIYLGRVTFPLGAQVMAFGGDRAWGIVTADDDQPYLVAWQLPSGP